MHIKKFLHLSARLRIFSHHAVRNSEVITDDQSSLGDDLNSSWVVVIVSKCVVYLTETSQELYNRLLLLVAA